MFIKPISVRYWLALLVAICIIPVWIGAMAALERAAAARHQLVETQLLHTARILSLRLDDRMISAQKALLALASSPALDTGDFEAFHRQARLLSGQFPGSLVVLASPEMQQLVNSARDFGLPLPARSMAERITWMFQTGQPVMIPYFTGKVTQDPRVGVDVPVIRDGLVKYDLGMSMPCDVLSAILKEANLPEGWIAAYIDDTGTIIGRNQDGDKFVGKKAKTPISPGEKLIESPTIDGVSTYVAVVGSEATRWGVAVGVPKTVIQAEIAEWRNWMLGAITGLTGLCAAIAWLVGNRIAKAIESLVAPAIRIGQGQDVIPPPSSILETQTLRNALANASSMLESHRQELRDRVQREDVIRRQSDELSRSNADLEQFAYVASHDLQTPLRNVLRYTQLLERRYSDRLDQDGREFISYIVDGGRQMGNLIDDLLEYSRVVGKPQTLAPISSRAALDQALTNLKADLDQVGGTVTAGDLPTVFGEQSLVASLFQNLLENAIKYRHPERSLAVTVTAHPLDAHLTQFRVSDNGIGIEAAYHEKIFEIFQRLAPASDANGTGIGLTLCRRIVHRLGGSIGLESAPGSGTTIIFTLRHGEKARADAEAMDAD